MFDLEEFVARALGGDIQEEDSNAMMEAARRIEELEAELADVRAALDDLWVRY